MAKIGSEWVKSCKTEVLKKIRSLFVCTYEIQSQLKCVLTQVCASEIIENSSYWCVFQRFQNGPALRAGGFAHWRTKCNSKHKTVFLVPHFKV